MRQRITTVLLLCWVAALPAQQAGPPVLEIRDLRAVPRDIADEVQLVFNATTSRRVTGDLTVAASEVIDGDVAVLGGQVVIAGRVSGKVVVINGSLVVRGAGRVGSATGPGAGLPRFAGS